MSEYRRRRKLSRAEEERFLGPPLDYDPPAGKPPLMDCPTVDELRDEAMWGGPWVDPADDRYRTVADMYDDWRRGL